MDIPIFNVLNITPAQAAEQRTSIIPISRDLTNNSSYLFSCSNYNECSDCMKQFSCAWTAGQCTSYSSAKTISQYAQCKSDEIMRSYCLNYFTTSYLPIYSGIVLQHKLLEGVIPAATYCKWNLQLTSGVITKISLSRRLNGIEMIKIHVVGKEGQVNSLTDPTDGSYSSDLYVSSGILNFEPDKLVVESVYSQISYNEEYKITFLEYSSNESNSPIAVIIVLIVSCFSTMIFSLIFVIIRSCIKNGLFRSIFGGKVHAGAMYTNAIKLELLFKELEPVLFDLAKIEFSQTNCIICLENFDSCSKVRILPECKHAFHTNCIDTWLKLKIKDELRCAHCNIIIKTQQEIDQLKKLQADQKENSHSEEHHSSCSEDQSGVVRGNLNDSYLDHDSRQIINNFCNIKQISKNDSPKYLPKESRRIQKTNDNKSRKSKLPEISLDIEECSQMANNGRSIRYILPSSKKIISKQVSVSSNKNNINISEESKDEEVVNFEHIRMKYRSPDEVYENIDSIIDQSSSKLIGNFSFISNK